IALPEHDCHPGGLFMRIVESDASYVLGDRVVIERDIDLSPLTIVRVGELGKVVYVDPETGETDIRLDRYHKGLAKWGNCIRVAKRSATAIGDGAAAEQRATKQSHTNDDRTELGKLLTALAPFRAIRGTMPLQYVNTFLLVALNEGKSVNDYAAMAGVSQSVMSRHLLDIGERNRHMEKGFGLVTYRPNPTELRKHEYF